MKSKERFHPSEADRLAQDIVRAGFLSRDDVVQAIIDMLDDDGDARDIRPIAVRAADGAIEDQLRAEAEWKPVTDCDLLEIAFENLEDRGIVARHNFTCCNTCGYTEINDEIRAARDNGVDVRGFAFYHQQDTQRAVEGGALLISYGALDGDVGSSISIGHEIVKALVATGLIAAWNGALDTRIHVTLEWRRRFPRG